MPTKKHKPAESERRKATVLFIDVAGFTEMSEKLDDEEITHIMNTCFEMMGSVIEHYGGTIDKFIGDSVMAVFGVPKAIENGPQKAINTAIEIRTKLHDINDRLRLAEPLGVHIGINTGRVVAGLVGSQNRKDYTVMGDAVNVASRLERASERGQILVGTKTYKNAQGAFEFRALTPLTLKGKKKPVRVFELLSTEVKVSRPQTDPDVHSIMVGRENMFDQLRSHIRMVLDGRGSIVSVIGEPGIGKSRLIAEIALTEEVGKVTWLEGAAISIGKDLSYYPIIDIIQRWAHINEGDSADDALHKLQKIIRNADPARSDEILPFIATLMGYELKSEHADRVKAIDTGALEQLILKSLKDLLTKAAARRPIVFVVEDLHWADLTTLEFIQSLFRLAETHAILFINVFRPDYPETSGLLLKTLTEQFPESHTAINLHRLNTEQVDLLIGNLLKTDLLPVDLKSAISRRADGNPLFVEEVVRSFIDDDVVRIKDGQFQTTDRIKTVVIPESIQEVLMSRLDRLDEHSKGLLKEASVIGRFFFRKILREITQYPGYMDASLDFLKKVQLVHERMRLQDIEYFFKHVLTQEVAYDSIMQKDRKALHLLVAEAIETVFAQKLNEFYGVLSWHYGRAEKYEQAEKYLISAGEEAARSGASNEAVNYYREALELYIAKWGQHADLGKIAQLEASIATALYEKGRMSESLRYLDQALAHRGVRMPQKRAGKILLLLRTTLSVLRDLYIVPGRKRKSPDPYTGETIELLVQQGWALYTIGSPHFMHVCMVVLRLLHKFEITRINNGLFFYSFLSIVPVGLGISSGLSKRMLDFIHRNLPSDDVKSRFGFKFGEGFYNFHAGAWKNLSYEEELVEQGLRFGIINDSSGYLLTIGLTLIELGEFRQVQLCCDKLEEIGESYENNWARTRKYLLNTARLLKCRELDAAVVEANFGIPHMTDAGYPFYALFVQGVKVQAYVMLEQMDHAEKTLTEIDDLIDRQGKTRAYMHLHQWHVGKFMFDLRKLEILIESGDQSGMYQYISNAKKSGSRALKTANHYAAVRTEVYKLMGTYHWLLGHQMRSIKWWNKSMDFGKQIEARPELARTYLEIARRLTSSQSRYDRLNKASPQDYVRKAEEIFTRLNLQSELEQVKELKM